MNSTSEIFPHTPKTPKELIDRFALDTIEATQLLYSKKLYGHLMTLIFSTIDAMGLLDSPPTETRATKNTFKEWVKKYLLKNQGIQFNENDFYAARCSVLHTFTSKSDLSNKGEARQIQYFANLKNTPMEKVIIEATNDIDNGAHVPAHIEDIFLAFSKGMDQFTVDFISKCNTSIEYEERLRNVLQPFSL
jgi:hypothetical protein